MDAGTGRALAGRPVVWLLAAGENLGSSRLQGLYIHRALRRRGAASFVAHAPAHPVWEIPWGPELRQRLVATGAGGLFVFQKLRGPNAVALMRELRARGGAVIFVDCDLDLRCRAALEADHVVVTSQRLADHYARLGVKSLSVLEDGIDYFERFAAYRRPLADSGQPLRLLWIGSATNWESAGIVRAALEAPELRRYRLVTVSDHPDATYRWSNRVAMRELARADVGALPSASGDEFAVKSANRLAMMMNAALPAVVSPLPSYLDLVQDGATGFVARDTAAWVRALAQLLDAGTRARIGTAARRDVQARLHPDRVADRWLDMLAGVAASRVTLPVPAAAVQRRAREFACLCRLNDAKAYWREGRRIRALAHALPGAADIVRSPFLTGIVCRAIAGRMRAAFRPAGAS